MPKKHTIIPYNPELKELARQLRKNMTLSEVLLWNELKQKKILGFDFDRQIPIGNYIVDFYCKELSLAIEIDGDSHTYRYDYDEERQRELEKLGVSFLRFDDLEVKKNMWNVLSVIEDWVERKRPTPDPPLEQGRLSREGNLRRYISTPVFIGSVPLGGDYPVRIQSMTNTNTLDTRATVAQCIRIIEAGADFVRITAQGVKEAENLANIKYELRKAGFNTPLIADIHFNPAVAEVAAGIVEKIRINPGNYVDKRASFTLTEFTDKEYAEELERIHARIVPLLKICTANGTAVRIGVNHGSLSDRIMTRYGNTPEGMAVSAMEFIKILRAENFHSLVLSMKSSDTAVMIKATRLLADMMTAGGFAYPLHLGVTEAGEGEDGRMRSAAGIGALLSEGIGDTIRVSLSEAPENEIPVAKEILLSIAGPDGLIKEPSERLEFKNHLKPYKPEVFTAEKETFLDENGKVTNVTISTFNPYEKFVIRKNTGTTILNPVFSENDPEKLAIDIGSILGKYFITKQADGVCISNKGTVHGEKLRELAFSLLQSTEARITRVTYLSCPTCGRTKFDLQDAVKEVKQMTSHLSGIRIAIMGCIVNGPGEMAGSDYGYVGAGPDKVHIYRGMEPVLKNVNQKEAAKELLRIIEEDIGKKPS